MTEIKTVSRTANTALESAQQNKGDMLLSVELTKENVALKLKIKSLETDSRKNNLLVFVLD